MTEHDILSDAEREALSEVMKAPIRARAAQRVLIVEDDQLARDLLSEVLELHGIQCIKAAGQQQAWHTLESDKSVALLLTDLRMPPGDGLELIRQLRRSERANMPVIIMSGNAEVKDAIDGMHLSVLDFLLKPIDTEKLTALIKRELHIE